MFLTSGTNKSRVIIKSEGAEQGAIEKTAKRPSQKRESEYMFLEYVRLVRRDTNRYRKVID